MKRWTITFAVLALSAAGCADGRSTVNVTVDSASALSGIDHLRVNVTDPRGRKAMELDAPLPGGAIPPAAAIALRFDKSIHGMVNVAVDAMPASGAPLASGAGTVDVRPSTVAMLTIALKQGGQATQLAFMQQPTDVAIGASVKPAVQVAVEDPTGALVTSANVAVTIALGQNPGKGPLGGTLTENTVGGVATFADLSIDATGDGYTLVASADMLASATSTPFNVRPPAWVAASNGLFGANVTALVVDPKHPATVYSATQNSGVWKSIDSAASWSVVGIGLPRQPITSLAIDPVNSTTLYAGADAVYKTSDGGVTWTKLPGSPTGVLALGVDPGHPSYVFSGVLASGFKAFRSSDGGATWTDISGGFVGSGPRIRAFAFHPSNGTVFIATYGQGIGTMPFGGTAWTPVTGTAPGQPPSMGGAYYNGIAYDPGDSSIILAGGEVTSTLWRTGNAGTAWTAASSPPPSVNVIAAYRPSSGPTNWLIGCGGIYAGTGVYRSTDGQSFYTTNGINEKVNTIAVDPINAGVAYAGTATGVYKTTDGMNWTLSINGLMGHSVSALAIDPNTPTNLYVGAVGLSVMRSTDGASTWSPTPSASAIPTSNVIAGIAIDDTDSKLIWAVANPIGFGATAWKSTDGGSSWAMVGSGISGSVTAVAQAPSVSGTFYSAVQGSAYVITAGATTWTPAGSGLPAFDIPALIVDPTSAMTVWAGTLGGGVFKTVNGGAAWSATISGLASLNVSSLAIDRTQPSTLYAGTDQGVFKTTDGTNWALSSTGLTSTAVTALAVSRTNPRLVFVGTYANGVFRSADGGASWTSDSVGLGSQAVTALAIDPQNPLVVYVGTYDGGVFKTAP